jgi:hypothetical protein
MSSRLLPESGGATVTDGRPPTAGRRRPTPDIAAWARTESISGDLAIEPAPRPGDPDTRAGDGAAQLRA